MKKTLFLFFSLLFVKLGAWAQTDPAQFLKELEAGKAAHEQGTYEKALSHLLNASTGFQSLKDEKKQYETLTEIGFLYRDWQIHDKSALYFSQAYELVKEKNPTEEALSLERLAVANLQLKNYPSATNAYSDALKIYENQKNPLESKNILSKLSATARLANDLPNALNYTLKALAISRNLKDTMSIVKELNNAGFLQKKLNQSQKSLASFQEALSLTQRHTDKSAAAWINAGVIYTNMADYANAKAYYQKALRMREAHGNTAEIAEVYNYLAINDLLNKNTEIALEEAETALEEAQKTGSKEVLQETYKILSDIYQTMGNFKESQNYFKLHRQMLDEMLAAKTQQNQSILKKQIETEKLEGEYKLLFSEREKQDLALKQLQLEAEKQQKDLELSQQQLEILQRDKELQTSNLALAQSEKDKIQQALLLTQKEFEGRQKEQAIAILNKDKELQNIALEKQKLVEAEQKNEIRFLETEKAQQTAQLQQEEKIRFYGLLILLLVLQLLLLAVFGFFQIRKKNKTLAQKNQQIEMHQAEILSQNEELVIQNEQLEKNRKEIQRSFDSITVLNEVGKQIISTLNLEMVFERVYENVNSLMDASVFGVGIYDPEKNLVNYRLAIENGVRYVPYSRDMNDKNQFAAWCITHQQDILIGDLEREFRLYLENYDKRNIKLEDGTYAKTPQSLIYTPLINQGRVVGVMTVQSFQKNAYSEYQRDLLRNIAIYTTIALNNVEDYQKMEEQKLLIENQNKAIRDSITTSLRIQKALLPLTQTLEEAFGKENIFLLFKPKDVVSGDFYWYTEQKRKKIMIVADCTGHGVPGALISMIGMELLDKIVNENRLTEPNKILQILHAEFVKIIKQQETRVVEGMELSVVTVSQNEDRTVIDYAGAMRPIYTVSENAIQILKSDKMAIGGNDKKLRHFTKHQIEVPKNTVLYMLTDGFQDQFGGTERRKFMIRRLRQLLIEIAPKPMPEQGEILEKTITEWIKAGKEKQTDDITLLGVRL